MELGTIRTNTLTEMTDIVFELVKKGTTFEVKLASTNNGYEGEYIIKLTGGH